MKISLFPKNTFSLIFLIIFFCTTFNSLAQKASPSEGKKEVLEKKYIKEINSLSKHKKVQKAFKTIEELESRTLNELIMLTEIPAPPFKEEVRAAKYAEMLKEAGADSVWTDDVGNVIALKKGFSGNKVVALDAHLDTVFPEGTDVTVKKHGDTLIAPGIGDDTRGLMVVLTVLRALEINNIETEADILFIGSVGEEGLGDLRGVKHLFRKDGPGIDSWIGVDGGDLAGIANGALGSLRYRVTFKGPGGHSWGAFGLANPHHALGRAINNFIINADSLSRSEEKVSYNIGRIGGGTSVNAIPFESWLEVDMRSAVPDQLKKMDQIFQKSVQEALKKENQVKREGSDLQVEIDMVGDRPSGIIPVDNRLVQNAMASAALFGATPTLRTGSTNSNIPISLGIPAVTIGRGGKGDGAHSLQEWWINDEGHLSIQRALILLLSEAGIAN
ncbi:M20/M25/M40 family metallo-hydrolase [Antarcticibacterium flavum]|uniref:M20/M25/M40 family metallo-hydrolase n=1 Tax=Antarcticibacterium flavum TaxID=2058175 RepID=A0A5B7X6N6_9FLAO|nr:MULTISPECIES: M20/M25/M40 family metallo-hydrolase [Antarcticibacterium]MCM4160861.1 peptidase M20 [Antarcticibacterium sp. W02-3]QCY71087.1 M20/M25/M40 family metallo-hydrolase [Antarcticibacterium flavum]